MSFHEVVFPARIGFGSSGGPERRTEVVTLGSGFEVRNAAWAQSRRRFNVGAGLKTLDDLATVTAFFEARAGRLYGFRFSDPTDHQSCVPSAGVAATDQMIGTGNGTAVQFQLAKAYSDAGGGYTRVITKPVAGSVRVAVAGVELAGGAFAVDPATGVVTLGTAPGAGQAVTAGFQFHTPVRFDTDRLDAAIEAFGAGRFVSIPLIEIKV
jgi:uncharacterized protein (TIGR02217 family)